MADLAFTVANIDDKADTHPVVGGPGPNGQGLAGMKVVFGTFTFNTDYPNGGYLAATLEALVGLKYHINKIYAILPCGGAVATNIYIPVGWDHTNRTLTAGANAGAEFATEGNGLDGAKAFCMVLGRKESLP